METLQQCSEFYIISKFNKVEFLNAFECARKNNKAIKSLNFKLFDFQRIAFSFLCFKMLKKHSNFQNQNYPDKMCWTIHKIYFQVAKIIKKVVNAIQIHLSYLFQVFDPVKSDGSASIYRTSKSINSQYILPFSTVLYILLDSCYVFYRENFHFTYKGMPDLFSHVIFPREFLPYCDIVLLLAVAMMFAVYLMLLRDPFLPEKCFMFVVVGSKSVQIISNGRMINQKEADKIYQFRSRVWEILKCLIAIIYFELSIFCFTNFALQWTGQERDYLWLIVVPLFLLYSGISKPFCDFIKNRVILLL